MRQDVLVYAIKRFALFPIYFLIFSVALFSVVVYAPGDPVRVAAGPSASDEAIERVRHELGLDKPLPVQYKEFVFNFLQLDFGESIKFRGERVSKLFWERFVVSAPLGAASLVISTVLGIAVGLFATFKKGTWLDTFLLSFFLFFAAIPSLLLIQFFILFFSLKLGLLPAGWSGGWDAIFTTTAIIPILTLSLVGVVSFARFVRTLTVNIVDEQYVLVAKAKGLSPRKIALGYVLRNAWLPLITVLVPALFTFFEGSFFVERIYGIPGLAQFTIDSVFARDYPVILNLGLLFSMISIFIFLLVDVLYNFADPRVNLK